MPLPPGLLILKSAPKWVLSVDLKFYDKQSFCVAVTVPLGGRGRTQSLSHITLQTLKF